MVLVLFIFLSIYWHSQVYFPLIYPRHMCSMSWLWLLVSSVVENYLPMSLHNWSLLVINLPASRSQMLFPLFKCIFISYLRIPYNVFRLYSTLSHFLTLPTFCHLTTTSQLYILFFIFNNFPSIICAAHVHMGLGPLPRAWLTYQGPYS